MSGSGDILFVQDDSDMTLTHGFIKVLCNGTLIAGPMIRQVNNIVAWLSPTPFGYGEDM
jgi:hypothetical protein